MRGLVRCLAIVTFLVGISWGAAAQTTATTAEPGTNRVGGDYTSFDLPAPDPGMCQASCMKDGRCFAWTFVRPGVQGPTPRCWLKNTVPPPRPGNCCVSGMKLQ
jgi:PAN domain-containing protein